MVDRDPIDDVRATEFVTDLFLGFFARVRRGEAMAAPRTRTTMRPFFTWAFSALIDENPSAVAKCGPVRGGQGRLERDTGVTFCYYGEVDERRLALAAKMAIRPN